MNIRLEIMPKLRQENPLCLKLRQEKSPLPKLRQQISSLKIKGPVVHARLLKLSFPGFYWINFQQDLTWLLPNPIMNLNYEISYLPILAAASIMALKSNNTNRTRKKWRSHAFDRDNSHQKNKTYTRKMPSSHKQKYLGPCLLVSSFQPSQYTVSASHRHRL